MSNFTYWLCTLLHLPVYFYCRYAFTSPSGCTCYFDRTEKLTLHDVGHPSCRHCTPTPHVQCYVCRVTYFDSIPPNPEVWTFSLWKGWRHVACR